MAVFHGVRQEHQHQGLDKCLAHEYQHSAQGDDDDGDLTEEENGIADENQNGAEGIELSSVHLPGHHGIYCQCTQLGHANHSHQHHVHTLVAEDVLHVSNGEVHRGNIANHEQAHSQGGPHELIVAHKGLPHLPQGGGFLLLGSNPLFLNTQQGEQQTQHIDNSQHHGAPEPNLPGAAQTGSHRLPGDHHDVHTDIGADSGESAGLFPLLLIGGQHGQQGPVADIVDAVGNVPQEVGHGEDDNEHPALTDSGKEEHGENGAEDTAYQDCGLELAPGGADVVDNQSGDGVVEGIEDAHDGQDHGGGGVNPDGQLQHIGQKMQQGIGLEGIEHIPAHGTQAETDAVAVVKTFHWGHPPYGYWDENYF